MRKSNLVSVTLLDICDRYIVTKQFMLQEKKAISKENIEM